MLTIVESKTLKPSSSALKRKTGVLSFEKDKPLIKKFSVVLSKRSKFLSLEKTTGFLSYVLEGCLQSNNKKAANAAVKRNILCI
ncbi:MAG: hypothetical protein QNK89_11080 [Lacinutrix sp.]|uniref:hypothetical protein n=1 Tax=Lacinutrix sp. TaxID=1937692 RepID=UPI0030A2B5E0